MFALWLPTYHARMLALLALALSLAALAAPFMWAPQATPAPPVLETGASGRVLSQLCLARATKSCREVGVPNVYVVVTGQGAREGFYQQELSDRDGSFAFQLVPGNYFAALIDERGHHLSDTVSVPVRKDHLTPLNLTLRSR